jgi:hypothetical protein
MGQAQTSWQARPVSRGVEVYYFARDAQWPLGLATRPLNIFDGASRARYHQRTR